MGTITSEIFQVGGEGFSASEDAAVYLLSFADGAALIDAGCGNSTKKIIANMKSHHVSPEAVEYLLLTHCHFDHTGGARAIQELTGCQIVAHEMDARFLEEGDAEVTAATWYGIQSMEPLSVDVKLAGSRNEITIGKKVIEAIHVPGHSPGSLVYLVESEGLSVLFAQDIHGPLHPSFLSNREDYLKSLDLLLALNADILCEGHYGIFRGKQEISGFIRRFM